MEVESVYPDKYADLKLERAGIYQFYLQKIVADEQLQICRGSFLVDPFLEINKEKIELNDIILHTVLVKCLGPFEDWEKRLEVAHKCGYNLIHFTPVQELGESNSSYSIKDHLRLNPNLSTNNKIFNLENLADFISNMEKNWNMLSIVDVVWNHVANNSEWIEEYTDAGYNLVNSPHLKPAFLVDRCLYYLNKEIMTGELEAKGLPSVINEQHHLTILSEILR